MAQGVGKRREGVGDLSADHEALDIEAGENRAHCVAEHTADFVENFARGRLAEAEGAVGDINHIDVSRE